MSDMPKRIWAGPCEPSDGFMGGKYCNGYEGMSYATEYVKADLAAEREREIMEVLECAAARDEADAYMFPSDLKDFQSRETGAMAHSIRIMRPGEDTTALFSIGTIRDILTSHEPQNAEDQND